MSNLPVKEKTMSIAKEFREFAARGNVIDLAIGVIIGGAFGQIVTSLVNDIVMPPIAYLTGNVNFSDIKILLKDSYTDVNGKTFQAITLNIGNFFQVIFNFVIIAMAIFLIIKTVNRLKKKRLEEEKQEQKEIIEDSKEVKILIEIRDALVKK
ncbi:MAG: large-conductance mechanosensitive channel protein MscL [Candidatus Dojkabacteria bacterium]